LKDELELTETNYKILLDKANDALLELNAQILEDNEKNKKYISNLQTYLEKMNGQRDRAIEKLMNNMSLSPDELREIIRG
jgi:predicted Zn-dependent protease